MIIFIRNDILYIIFNTNHIRYKPHAIKITFNEYLLQ